MNKNLFLIIIQLGSVRHHSFMVVFFWIKFFLSLRNGLFFVRLRNLYAFLTRKHFFLARKCSKRQMTVLRIFLNVLDI